MVIVVSSGCAGTPAPAVKASLRATVEQHRDAAVRERDPEPGTGLFVARDTPLFGEGGATIGTAHRGARVELVRVDGDRAKVALRSFGVEAEVLRSALTTSEVAAPAPPAYALAVENRAIAIVLPGAKRIVAKTLCTEPIGVFEETDAGVRVAQSASGIELVGLATDSGSSCRPRIVRRRAGPPLEPSPATGLRPPAAFRTTAFAANRELYLVERDDRGAPSCAKWSFRRASPGARATFETTRVFESIASDGPLRATLTYELAGAAPMIDRPTGLEFVPLRTVVRDAHGAEVKMSEGIALCGNRTATVVGETADGVLTLPEVSETAETLVAFHPDDVDVWYTRRAACEAALVRARTQPQTGGQRPKTAALLLRPSPGGC